MEKCPGCKFGDRCYYSHDKYKKKGEYEALVKRVAQARESSASEDNGGARAANRKALNEFQKKFCQYGDAC